jgi:hypothetical protein
LPWLAWAVETIAGENAMAVTASRKRIFFMTCFYVWLRFPGKNHGWTVFQTKPGPASYNGRRVSSGCAISARIQPGAQGLRAVI